MRTRLARVHRRIAARDEAQAVVRLPGEKFDIMPASSARLAAMLSVQHFASRVLGIFSPDVPFGVFLEALA